MYECILRELCVMFGRYDVFSIACVLCWLVYDNYGMLASYECDYRVYDVYDAIFLLPYETLGC